MATTGKGDSEHKDQFNTYIPHHLKVYVDRIHKDLEISKSDFMWLLLDYAERTFTNEDIGKMRRNMLLFGTAVGREG